MTTIHRSGIFILLSLCFCAFFPASGFPLPLTPFEQPRDSTEAKTLPGDIGHLRRLAEEGDAQAQYHLGIIYSKGQEVDKNIFEALSFLRHAAEQGHVEAQYHLGLLYNRGNSVADAREWMTRAALNGHRPAQVELGRMLAEGNGGHPDYVEAYKWWLIAARHGDPAAERNRERLETLMTEDQIRRAVSLAVAFEPAE